MSQHESSVNRILFVNQLLLALDEATAAMLRARSMQEVVHAIGEKTRSLGIGVLTFVLDEEQAHLHLSEYSVSREQAQKAQALLGTDFHKLRLPLIQALQEVVLERKSLFHHARQKILAPELQEFKPALDLLGNVILAPLYMGERPYGMLVFVGHNLEKSHIPAVNTFAHQVSLTLENIRLLEESHHRSEQLRALALYLQNAQEAERARLAREIHDEFAQVLTAMRMEIDWIKRHLPASNEAVLNRLQEIDLLVQETIQKVRHIAHQLRPGLLDDLGLLAAIEWQASEFTRHSGITCTLHLPAEEPALAQNQVTALFRILQEALTNVARHANATHVEIGVECTPRDVRLWIHDNGSGFTTEILDAPMSLGLLGMRERAEALGGTLSIHSEPGQGTTVEVTLPR